MDGVSCKAGLFLLALLLIACGEPVATPEPTFLQAAGAMAMAPLVTELAAAFHEQSPTVNIEVEGLGTEFGLKALEAGEVDFALASWLPPGVVENNGWQATAIARDGIAVIVHPGNPLEEVGLLQLQDLFGGQAHWWKDVGGLRVQGSVQPVSREAGSGTRAAFEALAMGDRPVTPLAVVVPSEQAVVAYVAGHHNAIGYVSMGQATPQVKVLKVEGLRPTPQTAGDGSYPLSRELWLVAPEPLPEAVQAFFDFALSPAGQQIVGRRYGAYLGP